MSQSVMGFTGGSGLYEIEEMSIAKWVKIKSQFGEPSDEVLTSDLSWNKAAFLPLHGRGHKLSPNEINYRANFDVLKPSSELIKNLISS